MKKVISLLLAFIMVLSLAACTANGGKTGGATTDPLTKDDVIKIGLISHASWPFSEDWKVWKYIEEGTGATLDIAAYPASDAGTKFSLMFAAPDTLPDIITATGKVSVDKYIQQGATIAFDDVSEYMPSYNAWVDSLTEEEYQTHIVSCKGADGKVHFSPVKGREKSQNVRAWLYRKDIFEKHNLAVPTTFDELYAVCKQLKALYPESYPYCVRQKFVSFDVSGASWKPYWRMNAYYDYENEKWSYGATEDVFEEMLVFYKKMIAEDLMPSDFMTISNATWQELITTDRGFVFPDYQTRIDFFNGLARVNNPEFEISAFVPPVAKEGGVPMVNKYNFDSSGVVMCNSRDDRRIANTAKYMDWFYSDEAVELVSWGKEGETYEVSDGKKKFITDEKKSQPNSMYGFSTYGTFARMDSEAVLVMESEDIAKTRDMVLQHTISHLNPTVSFNEEEQKVIDEYSSAIGTYVNEMVSKFVLGTEPLSKFDEFRETINEMGVEKILAAYESAYARVK